MNSITARLGIHQRGIISFVGAGGKSTLMFRLAEELAKENLRVLVTTTTKMFKPGKDIFSEILITDSSPDLMDRIKTRFRHSNLLFAAAGYIPGSNKVQGFSRQCIDTLWESGCCQWILTEADGAACKPLKAPADHEPAVPKNTKYLLGLMGLSALGKPADEDHIHRVKPFLEITGSARRKTINMDAMASLMRHPKGLFKNCPQGARKIAFINQADTLPDIGTTEYFDQQMQLTPQGMPDLIAIGQTSASQVVLRTYTKPRGLL